MTTEILGLDEILASQSQKEVAHNTALRQIEGRLVRALSKSVAVPPSSPAEGASYIVAAGATSAWSGQASKIAHFFGGAWKFWQPIEGVRLWVNDEDKVYAWDGSAWVVNGGDPAAAVAVHVAATDPHTQYALESAIGQAGGIAALGSDGKVPTAQLPTSAQTGGTVTSVALSVPGLLYTVSGNPVTASGTLTFALKTQAKNTFLAGPATGADAAPTMRTLTAADLPAQPFDIHAFYPGVPSASAKILRTPVARAVTFPDDFAGSYGTASVAATASTAFDVAKNGTSVGTITFAAGATSAAFVTSGTTVTLAAGDRISITAPPTADATLADVGFVLAGTR